MKKLAIVGVGSAGIQAICHYISWLDNSWEITSIHNPSVDIVGIGESTNPTFVVALETGLSFNLYDHLKDLDGTLKLGTYYKGWRDREFINPLISGNIALHFNTHKLKEFALPRFKKIWGSKFKVVEGNVDSIDDLVDKAVVVVDGKPLQFDYVMDCRGFPKDYSGYNVIDKAPLNHALVHNIAGDANWLYTGHTATVDGWMFEIPLTSRKSYGYMFNDKITNTETAKNNFATLIGVDVGDLQNIEYKFNSYYAKSILGSRVIKNGNAALFFEPMFANSLWMYNRTNRNFYDYIKGRVTSEYVNNVFTASAISIEEMICFHYHGGSLFNSEFWRYTKKYASKKIKKSPFLKHQINIFKKLNANNYWGEGGEDVWVYNQQSLSTIDRNFNYNYFKKHL